MSMKSVATVAAFVVALSSQMSFAALPPLSQEARLEMSSHIASGYVISVKKTTNQTGYGSNAHYTIKMILTGVDKNSNGELQNGETLSFHYWKAEDRDSGWCGDGGQYGIIKYYQSVKAYLNFDELTGRFMLLNPNGFDHLDS